MLSPPTQVGRYQIVGPIGEGGMGTLYKALDPKLDRQIAIKVLRGDDEELRERFAREARSAAHLRHPNIVTIFDVGEDKGQPYIAMEFIEGHTLAHVIQHQVPLELTRKLELVEALCDGLGFAHKASIVHRDIKPANLMVDPDGALKILDFGIARSTLGVGVTQAGMVLGTLNYMSPEQLSGQKLDARSDIFAVGIVLYELVSYRQAFPGGLETGVVNRILGEQPQSLASVPGVTPEILTIIERAIAKAPEQRYQDLGTMRRELQAARARLSPRVAPVVPAAPRATPPVVTPTPTPALSRRSTWSAVSAVAVAGLAVGGYLAFKSSSARPAPPVDNPAATPANSQPKTNPAPAPPTTTSPPAPAPAPAAAPPAAAADAPDPRIATLVEDARRSYGRKDRVKAMDDVRQALNLRADDRATHDLVLTWLKDAVAETRQAEGAAAAVGRGATTSKDYEDGTLKQSEGTLRASDHPDQAVRLLWDATALFGKATTAGRTVAGAAPPPAKAATPPSPAPAADARKPEPPPIDEKAEVLKTLDAYVRAEDALDAEAVQRIYTKAAPNLKQSFDRLRSQKVQLSGIEVTVNGTQATAQGQQKISAVPKNGNEFPAPASRRTFTLTKMNGAWIITDIK